MSLPYETALVTGASRGIGAAICRALAGAGVTVYALARTAPALEALAADCGVVPVVADVRDTAAILAGLNGAPVDILVNNAGGLATVKPLHEQTPEEVAETIALNLTAPLTLIRALLPGMIARRRGHVFNITSTAAHNVFPQTTAYGAAKAGLSQAGKVLRYDLAGSNVRLTELIPGRVQTDFYLQAFAGDAAALTAKMYAAQRALQPADIADALMAALVLPAHVDLAQIDISPTDQAPGGHVYGTVAPD
ncbi:SDR family oxidoreductase [Ensifer soli]|uniref:SDR family oxidoreductase n=1 Tax=Ciceribacter sp. sgz301302 TaxID=3342379 RepID=UPI0035B8A991